VGAAGPRRTQQPVGVSDPGRVLDVTALAAAAGGSIYIGSLLRVSLDHGVPLAVPAVALAEALRGAGADVYRLDLLVAVATVQVSPLDLAAARATAELMARTGADLSTAHAAWIALDRGSVVVTADPRPLRALHPDLRTEQLP